MSGASWARHELKNSLGGKLIVAHTVRTTSAKRKGLYASSCRALYTHRVRAPHKQLVPKMPDTLLQRRHSHIGSAAGQNTCKDFNT